MKTENGNTHLVDEYLQTLEGMQPVETKPFFYSRLKSRMEEKQQVQTYLNVRPAFVICTLFVFLVMNIWMINSQKQSKDYKEAPVSSLSGFADTYNFTVTGY